MNNVNRHRATGLLSLGGGFVLLALLGGILGIPGIPQGLQAATGMAGVQQDLSNKACAATAFALDPKDETKPNPDKEVKGAFGPAITARGEDKVKAELKERRTCGEDGVYDVHLTAAHYSEWSHYNLTSVKVGSSSAEINAFAARIAADPSLYKATLKELEKLEGESKYGEGRVKAGTWSLYMVPDGNGGVIIKVGRTSEAGTNAVFKHGKVEIRYRLDCGAQPNRDKGGFSDVDKCTREECAPPPQCPVKGTWPDCFKPCPPGMVGERQPHCFEPCPPGTVGKHRPDCFEPCPPGTVGKYQPNCYTPCPWDASIPKDNARCNEPKWIKPSPQEPGWTPRGTDNGVTDGQQSANQRESGQTRGNAVDDQVPSDTRNNTTTPDTKPSNGNGGGPVAPGATAGGDDQDQGVVDEENTNQDDGGTDGDTCVPDPIVGITCP